jgi:hypothetical protein
MVATAKSSKRTPEPTAETAEQDLVVVSSFRVPREVVEKFDAWVAKQNEGRRGPRLSRVDVLRGLMDWAGDERPTWEQR